MPNSDTTAALRQQDESFKSVAERAAIESTTTALRELEREIKQFGQTLSERPASEPPNIETPLIERPSDTAAARDQGSRAAEDRQDRRTPINEAGNRHLVPAATVTAEKLTQTIQNEINVHTEIVATIKIDEAGLARELTSAIGRLVDEVVRRAEQAAAAARRALQ